MSSRHNVAQPGAVVIGFRLPPPPGTIWSAEAVQRLVGTQPAILDVPARYLSARLRPDGLAEVSVEVFVEGPAKSP